MIALIEHQRDFEEQIKFIKEAKTIDESGNTMMKPS
jgi:flagellar basal body rod protein FlgF